mmetsp:Transcript_26453/g.45128  ORF Transcript_26453/g.45128 Transcript_26453/m.45128 type:complete len:638 (-) Transcript_26453:167-2080(-)
MMSTWRSFSRLLTCFVPDEWARKTEEAGQAWREKVAFCLIMLVANVGFLGFGGLIHTLACVDGKKFNDDDDIVGSIRDTVVESVTHEDPTCRALNTVALVIMFAIVAILAVQCLCSIIYLVRVGRWCCKAVRGKRLKDAKVIVMVPCYNEGVEELTKTIESVRDEEYPSKNKLLLFIADGNVKGRNSDGDENHAITPAIISELLGYERTDRDPMYSCSSTGYNEETKAPKGNRAKLYHGIHNGLNYMVIEKCGLPVNGDVGNRGKRDSQIMLSGLMNKLQHNVKFPPETPRHRDLNELERAADSALRELGFPLASDTGGEVVKYLMAVDADTRLDKESIIQMIYSMESKPKTLALCGETKVDNKNDSWVTKFQVFEYYTNHGLKKAFESVFGTVTCLPGCFTMYRLFDQDNEPLFACDWVCNRYAKNDVEIKTLHEKNLYKLGEDRLLTTLLLQKFPRMNLKFVPEAHCYTIVPDRMAVLLSQRRRWINSTFHNMLYLLGVGLPGICCCSMKFILILDMTGTLILPSSLLYVGIMIYKAINGGVMPSVTLVVLAFSVFVQLIAPLLKLKFKYLWSAVIYYVIGVPVFYFVLPIYSFWHMDDFSWGTTRQTAETQTADDDSIKATSTGESDEEGIRVL